MSLPDFSLEIYFAKYEFAAKYLLCCSDAETFQLKEILSLCSEDPETRALWENLQLGYTESTGLPALREEIVKQYYQGLSLDEILCFAGAEEGIYATMRALLTEEDHVVVVTPAYQSLLSIPAAAVNNEKRGGAGITTIDLEVCDGRWSLNLDKLRACVKPGTTKMIVMNFPQNPTGALLTREEQLRVVDICKEMDLWVFFDEVYRGLERDVTTRLPPMCALYEKAFSLGVMSKSLGMAGLRIGWIASQDKSALAKIGAYKHYLSICNSAPSEIVSLIALKKKDSLLDRNNAIIAENMVLVEEFLSERKFGKYFEWAPPRAGCIGYMKFKGFPCSNMTLTELAHDLVTKYGCLLLPGMYFPSSLEAVFDDHFRFGFGRKNFPECLSKLEEALLEIIENQN